MTTVYSDDALVTDWTIPSIFLAGPTPRSAHVPSWRPDALFHLECNEFHGRVFVPERRDWFAKFDYTDQVEWEYKALHEATIIVFWIPRNLETMPAFTTNVEFGYYLARRSDRIVYGRPPTAPGTGYLDWLYSKENQQNPIVYNTLEDTIGFAIAKSTKFMVVTDGNVHYV